MRACKGTSARPIDASNASAPCNANRTCATSWSGPGRAPSLLARAMTRADGLRLRSGATATFVRRLNALDLPPATTRAVAPLCRVIDLVTEELMVSKQPQGFGGKR